MADATVVSLVTGKLIGDKVDGVGPRWDQPKYDFGEAAFNATDDTFVEVPTTLTECNCVLLLPKTIAGAAGDDALYSDGVITSAKITVGRDQEVADSLGFYYFFGGK